MLIAALLPLLLAGPAACPESAQRTPEEILGEIRSLGNDAPVKLFDELALLKSDEAYEAFVKALDAVSKVDKVCAAYAAFRHFNGVGGAQQDAADYLAERARAKQEKLALHAVWHLGTLWPSSREHLFELALEHETHDGRTFALMHLVDQDMQLTPRQLGKLAKSKDDDVRYEGLLARAALVEDTGKRVRSLDKSLLSRDAVERLVAVERLATEASPTRFEALRERLGDEDGRVARKALASLERTRAKPAVELLIARLGDAQRAERQRIARVLERLTGKALGTEPGRWQRWWEAEGASFEIGDAPPPESVEPVATGDTSSFYGLPIYAERLVFAIDTSDSMKAESKQDASASRIQIAKRELSKAIEGLPESAEFDIVNFGKRAWSWKGELVLAKNKHERAALEHVAKLQLSWGTEIYAALREAYRDPRADTILFLTDGDPQLSLMQDRGALQRIVAQWNRTRHTTIDCITIGTERKWLQKLATLTGGRYLRID